MIYAVQKSIETTHSINWDCHDHEAFHSPGRSVGRDVDRCNRLHRIKDFLRGIVFGGERLRSQILISKQSLKCPSELARRTNTVY